MSTGPDGAEQARGELVLTFSIHMILIQKVASREAKPVGRCVCTGTMYLSSAPNFTLVCASEHHRWTYNETRTKSRCRRRHRPSLSLPRHHGGRNSWVPPYTRGSVSLTHGGQVESLVPPYTRGRVCLSISIMGGRAKAWCLLIHRLSLPQ